MLLDQSGGLQSEQSGRAPCSDMSDVFLKTLNYTQRMARFKNRPKPYAPSDSKKKGMHSVSAFGVYQALRARMKKRDL